MSDQQIDPRIATLAQLAAEVARQKEMIEALRAQSQDCPDAERQRQRLEISLSLLK